MSPPLMKRVHITPTAPNLTLCDAHYVEALGNGAEKGRTFMWKEPCDRHETGLCMEMDQRDVADAEYFRPREPSWRKLGTLTDGTQVTAYEAGPLTATVSRYFRTEWYFDVFRDSERLGGDHCPTETEAQRKAEYWCSVALAASV